MSLNFTGSTAKRRVNLGNRSLMARNKNSFLQNVQEDRVKREKQRMEANAAIKLQSCIRRFIVGRSWHIQLSENWDGTNVYLFALFFNDLVDVQPLERSFQQLNAIRGRFNDLPNNEKKVVLRTVINTFDIINRSRKSSFELITVIVDIITTDVESEAPLLHSINCNTLSLIETLVCIYLDHRSTPVLKFLFYFMPGINLKPLLPLIADQNNTLMEDLVGLNLEKEALLIILDKLFESRETLVELTISEKLSTLRLLSGLLFDYNLDPVQIFNSKKLSGLSKLLLTIPELKDVKLRKLTPFCNLQFLKCLINSDFINRETFVEFYFSINSFAFNIMELNDFQTFGSSLTITIITTDINGTLLLQSQKNAFSTLQFNNVSHNPSYIDLLKSFGDVENINFWYTIYFMNEMLWNIIYLSSDSMIFQRSKMSQDSFIQYTLFLRNVISTPILSHEIDTQSSVLDKYETRLYYSLLKSTMKTLNAVHLRSYQLQLFDEGFWHLKNFSPTIDSIASAAIIITDLNNNDVGETSDLELFFINLSIVRNKSKNLITFLYALTYVPYMLPFEVRADLFHEFIKGFKKRYDESHSWFPTSVEGVVHRDNIFLESFEAFGSLKGVEFQKPFSVQFINEFGEREVGIDGGGLTKELLTSIVTSSFIPSNENRKSNLNYQFFSTGTNHVLYCNNEMFFKGQYKHQLNEPITTEFQTYIEMMRFLGKVMGKCIYENVLVDLTFANFFLRKWCQNSQKLNLLGQKSTINLSRTLFQDLKEYDIVLYKSLNGILAIENEAEMDALGLTFSVTDIYYKANGEPQYVEVSLVPNGKQIPVTVNNKLQFVLTLTRFKLEQQTSSFVNGFLDGLFSIIKPYWLSLFDSYEIQTLISGGEQEINVDDLFNNAEFGGFLITDKTVQDLYSVLKEFDHESRASFLKFVTSCPKQPLLGFKELKPRFGIRNAGRSDLIRLPTASTCVNLLKIPDYQDKEILRTKLLQSINSRAGFDLS